MRAFLIVMIVIESIGLMRAYSIRDPWLALGCAAFDGWAIYLLCEL